jgi:hypothetical protein
MTALEREITGQDNRQLEDEERGTSRNGSKVKTQRDCYRV